MSFFAGLATGAAKAGSERHDYIQEQLEKKMDEARKQRVVLNRRKTEANELRARINTMSKATGVRKEILFDAYKSGQLDNYAQLIEKARANAAIRGRELSPETLESWWEVPNGLASDGEMETQIDKIFGLINKSVDNNKDNLDDITAGRMLYHAIGGAPLEQVDRSLSRQDVGGYSAADLLGLPDPEAVEGAGGRFAADMYRQLDEDAQVLGARGRGSGGSGDKEFKLTDIARTAGTVAASLVAELRTREGTGLDDATLKNIEAQLDRQLQAAMINNNIDPRYFFSKTWDDFGGVEYDPSTQTTRLRGLDLAIDVTGNPIKRPSQETPSETSTPETNTSTPVRLIETKDGYEYWEFSDGSVRRKPVKE